MFIVGLGIGVFSYIIFFFGIIGVLYEKILATFTIFYLVVFVGIIFNSYKNKFSNQVRIVRLSLYKKNSLVILTLIFLCLLMVVNVVGSLGPELAFDALWYHLTLPRLYIQNHSIEFIPGGLLYYSAMPQLTEMLYVVSLSLQGEILAKFVHFLFGIGTSIVLYHIARKFVDTKLALLAVLIFYSNLVVSWESITAYVDLVRAFFEALGLLAFSNWLSTKKDKWLIVSGAMIGFAVAVKLLAFGSAVIFSALILFHTIRSKKKSLQIFFKHSILFGIPLFVVISPWLLFSYVNTGNLVYPFFTTTYPITVENSLLSPLNLILSIWTIFIKSADPISPIYLISFPLLAISLSRFKDSEKMIAVYCFVAIIVWYITPRTGGGRFLLPYLPALSLLIVLIIHHIVRYPLLRNFLISICFLIAFITISYRATANAKYIPVIMGMQSKHEFLTNNLNFSFGDFYDVDNYFTNNVKTTDRVLLYGFHNLYYVNFPFLHESWIKKGDTFNYIATQNTELPKKYSDWKKVYENSRTNVILYRKDVTK